MSTAERLLVWIEEWQFACCGRPFAVGSHLDLQLQDASEDEWLDAVLGADLAERVTHREECHSDPDETTTISGVVERIRAVSCDWARHRPDSMVHVPVPGSVRFDAVDELPAEGTSATGYLIDVRTVG